MKKLHLALLAMVAIALGLLSPTQASANAAEWNDGFHDEDQIISCYTGQPTTGVSANVSWMSPTGQVPKVGETFWLRGYAGLVGLPCSGKVAIIPEILVPAGVEHADGDVRWDISKPGEQQLTTDPLAVDWGDNGGILIGNADGTPFTLRQGEILEFQFPVRATRELKGPATQQPMCQSRLDGDAPCPIAQSGDHLQVAFTTTGHGGDRWFVTPFVGLFATPVTTPAPTTKPTPTSTSTPTPAPGGNPAPAPGQGPAAGKAASTTAAKFKVATGKRGKAVVTVVSSRVPVGQVVVRDKGKVIGRADLRADQTGRVVVRLARLRKGTHKLVASYAGSSTVAASASAPRRITLR